MKPMTWWERASVVADIFAKVAIPLLVAFAVQWWSSARSNDEAARSMVQIAVGILMEDPKPETASLRSWAIDVLRSPEDPPKLSDSAAEELKSWVLPWNIKLKSLDILTLKGNAAGTGHEPAIGDGTVPPSE